MATQIVMDQTGDTRHWFDPNDTEALSKAEKRFKIDRMTVNASVDVFNLTNANIVLNRVTTQNSATANRVTEVTGPRVLRFGVRFSF